MMSGALLQQETERIRDAADIVKVVGEYVHLRRVGTQDAPSGYAPSIKRKGHRSMSVGRGSFTNALGAALAATFSNS